MPRTHKRGKLAEINARARCATASRPRLLPLRRSCCCIFNPSAARQIRSRRHMARGPAMLPPSSAANSPMAQARQASPSRPISNGRAAGARSMSAIPPAIRSSSPSRASGACRRRIACAAQKLVVAIAQSGQGARDQRAAAALWRRSRLGRRRSACPSPKRPAPPSPPMPSSKRERRRRRPGLLALADDSGLCVDALDGDPGIYSARWAGPAKDFALAMRNVEEKLQAKGAVTPEARRAHFVCVLCLAWPDGQGRESSKAGSTARSSGRRAARTASATIRCSCPTASRQTFGEMDPDARSTHVPSRPRLREARRCRSSEPGFGIYVHWPFCKAKCPYCDFNSHVRHAAGRCHGLCRSACARAGLVCARDQGPHGGQHLLRRRHAIADAACRRCPCPRRDRRALAARRRCRSDTRGQSDQCRSGEFPRLPRRRRQPRLGRRAGAR